MKNLSSLFLLSLLCFASCDKAENELSFENYYENIYTVSSNGYVAPEWEDTLHKVMNISAFDLEPGDRARLVLKEYYDSEVTDFPEMTIERFIKKIPVYQLSGNGVINSDEYNAYITSINRYSIGEYYRYPIWAWKGVLNVNATFNGASNGAQFAMSVIKIENDTIDLQLHIKADASSGKRSEELLSFDLRSLKNVLESSDLSKLSSHKTLKARIFGLCMYNEKLANRQLPDPEFLCEFENPFY